MCMHMHRFPGLFYYILGNLSPSYRSNLKCIQLVAIAELSVIVKYGSNKILEAFMADIKELEEVGTSHKNMKGCIYLCIFLASWLLGQWS